MNYKKFIPVLILFLIFNRTHLHAQDKHEFDPKTIYVVGVTSPYSSDKEIPLISIKPDNHTKRIYPHNFLTVNSTMGLPNTNFVYLEGTRSIQIYTPVKPAHLKEYRYRILLNDTLEITHWQTPKIDSHALKSKYIFHIPSKGIDKPHPEEVLASRLASIDCKNKKITVQIYNINYPNNMCTVYIYNKSISKPVIRELTASTPFEITNMGIKDKRVKVYTNISLGLNEDAPHNAISIDSLSQIKVIIDKNDAQMIYGVYVKNLSIKDVKPLQIPTRWEYAGVDVIKKDGSRSHKVSCYTIIPKYVFHEPGKYEITVVPRLSGFGLTDLFKDQAATATFIVLPPSQKSYTLRQIAPYVGLSALILGIGFWQYKTYQNKKLSKETRQKEMAKTQLSSIRSQLNPHFMYNALAGIQNLMNKNETEKANHYLGKFSRLTRNVLEGSVNELISIANEEVLLDDYLQMEQLRFGFQYTIAIDKNINKENVEIPTMLLQPFVENAVKHGMAALKSKGHIHIHFSKNKDSLFIQIEDNGAGFDTSKEQDGFGLNLSQKRIALLNKVYKKDRITLKTQSYENGTNVSINLHNWI